MEVLFVVLAILVSIAVPASFLIRMATGKREFRRAPGVIVAVRQTGLSANDQPQVDFTLRVEPASERSFEAHFICIVSKLDIPGIKAGRRVVVTYDPSNFSAVGVDYSRSGAEEVD